MDRLPEWPAVDSLLPESGDPDQNPFQFYEDNRRRETGKFFEEFVYFFAFWIKPDNFPYLLLYNSEWR
jgi:hypothetical protein